ncbi:CDP-alcohol phosphatidyltransferase family protein [Aestuariivirga sp.]|uniref:CDP-alcohol phosphatidyltransferase family protein n=1 Tax=Aestuariivirga sp. TaxID=2650926 RepID=UPI0039E5B7F3
MVRLWFGPHADAYVRHIPANAVTILALCFGMTGLIFADQDQISAAIGCVLMAGLLDACDGRVARATNSASRFGAELDSLSDVVCFGAVPAFILYRWGLSAYGATGWLVCLCLVAAAALRLARFNVAVTDQNRPSWQSHFFVGIPAPGGAYLALLPVYAANSEALPQAQAVTLALFAVPVVSGLMVSAWPSFSAKAISRKAMRLLFIPSLFLAALVAFGLFVAPWLTLTLCGALYLWTLPVSKWRFDLHIRRGASR